MQMCSTVTPDALTAALPSCLSAFVVMCLYVCTDFSFLNYVLQIIVLPPQATAAVSAVPR
jgi:hypothetical protein